MIEVSEYNGEDISALARLWADGCGVEFDLDTALKDIKSLHEGENSEVFVLKVDERVVGGLGIQILEMFFTRDCYSAVRYLYIDPEYRYLAKKLINHARKWSQDMGCTRIMVCSNDLSHPVDEFYRKMDFRKFETVYIGDL